MAQTYTEVYYHFVWATKQREPTITPAVEELLYRYLRHKCRELCVDVHALNGLADHVHLCCTLPTTLCIADFMETLKGASARFINQQSEDTAALRWQPGYGALTFAKSDLSRVVAYIEAQKTRHAAQNLSDKMERL